MGEAYSPHPLLIVLIVAQHRAQCARRPLARLGLLGVLLAPGEDRRVPQRVAVAHEQAASVVDMARLNGEVVDRVWFLMTNVQHTGQSMTAGVNTG